MAESSHNQNHHHNHHPQPPPSSRLGLRNPAAATVGEIVEVQGGHIVRSIGRKDRHSKVCTAKGPRDRRVRLAAHTAIQFYDVQDRLGYDRPSKAVDWLIKKAQSAIDELAQLPAWHPTATCPAPNHAAAFDIDEVQKKLEEEQHNHNQLMISNVSGEDEQQQQQNMGSSNNNNNHNSSFLPPSMDSDAIADTIKSFFPMGASAESSSSAMQQFQSFPTPDLLSRSHSQDLRLSLQSFQDPMLLHHHHHHHEQQQHQQHQQHQQQQNQQAHSQVLLSGIPLNFDGTGTWQDHHHHQTELSRFQRPTSWNSGGDAGGAYQFNSQPASQPLLQQLLGHNQFFQQRGPLQSSNTPSVRAWIDHNPSAANTEQNHHQHQPAFVPIYPSSVSGIGFSGGFSGFHIPARIQGDEEEHDGYSDKPSSASSDSRH